MLHLPDNIMRVLRPFSQAFSERIWDWVQVLLVGAILTPGKRTVCAILRVMGLSELPWFQNYHRVLNRAKWSPLRLSQILLGLLVLAFLACGAPLIIAADETLERRKGPRIKQKGAFRDAVRSSKSRTVTSFGLRWVSMMLLVSVPWSSRVWALPFLTVLAPSQKTNRANGKRHKTSIDWIAQMIVVVRRWLPERPIVLVVDGALAAVKLGQRCAHLALPVTYVSRLRLDAVLHDPAPAPVAGKRGPKPKKGKRQVSLKARLSDPRTEWHSVRLRWYGGVERVMEVASGTALWYTPGEEPLALRWVLVRDPSGELAPQAFFATEQGAAAEQIVEWFVMRWSEEVTFEEAREHLGLETQRQWSERAIERTTPVLLGLFSLVTLLAHRLTEGKGLPVRRAAWYSKSEATFADALALVRQELWSTMKWTTSPGKGGVVEIPVAMLHGLIDTLCYAA
jgi:hypothetical protein